MQPINTKIWLEEAESDNPYATKTAYCCGYDVYGDMLGNCRWVEMLYLLFKGNVPEQAQADLLEDLAVTLANAGPRDAAVHAAMCGGVGRSVAASCLTAALAVGAGQYSGAREVYLLIERWQQLGTDLDAWQQTLSSPPPPGKVSTWPQVDHPLGFDPHGVSTPTSVKTVLNKLSHYAFAQRLQWLNEHRQQLEAAADKPATLMLIAAAAMADLDLDPEQGEMLLLLLRLPGAAAHALEQKRDYGHKQFPFPPLEVPGLKKDGD